jgi:putative ABC transport system permease protein
MRISRGYGLNVQFDEKTFIENDFAFADSNVFEMMDVQLLHGNETKALQELSAIVLSESLAEKYFGSAEAAMEKTLTIMGESFVVHGIMEDYPRTSSVYFDALMPYKTIEARFEWLQQWNSNSIDTYVQLAPGAGREELESKLPAFVEKYISEHWSSLSMEMYLQPMEDIHLHSRHIKFQIYNHQQGDIQQVRIFSVIALLILLIACINYINLATSMALKRSREVGVRKVAGADRKKLILQFLGESYTLTLLSALVALAGIQLFLPMISNILGMPLAMDFSNPVFAGGLAATVVVVGLFSGLYPAFYISGFRPTVIFSGFKSSGGRGTSAGLRKALVVTQFAVSVVIIIATIIAFSQVRFFQTTDKGYNDEAVYAIPLHFEDERMRDNIQLLKETLKTRAGIRSIAASSGFNGVAGNQSSITTADSAEQEIMARFGYVDEHYFPLMDIQVTRGRNFSPNYPTDTMQAVILNEIAVKKFGWDQPLGKRFEHPERDSAWVEVIGVIEDYNYYSLTTPIEPAVFLFNPNHFQYVITKMEPNGLTNTVDQVKEGWQALFPGQPFDGFFIRDRYKEIYAGEINTMKIFGIFSLLCIFISCLGLFGLISFVVIQKTREIAIRKVFGSNIKQITLKISREFLVLILAASVIGVPVAYYFMDRWLDNFAYQISLQWHHFFAGIALALIIAFLTMVNKVVSAARNNPAESLHYE